MDIDNNGKQSQVSDTNYFKQLGVHPWSFEPSDSKNK